MRNTLLLLLAFFLLGNGAIAQNKLLRKNQVNSYIHQWRNLAVSQMLNYDIPASIILAQAIVESAAGTTELAENANNHFGIKCHNWSGYSYFYDDDAEDECFRKYLNSEDSFADHSQFLSSRKWYQSLFSFSIHDYKSWAIGLTKAGYATHPKYAQMLIKVIEDFHLYELDKIYFAGR